MNTAVRELSLYQKKKYVNPKEWFITKSEHAEI